MTVSTESAMISRLTSEKCMPSWPIELPSDTEMVPNSIGKPPAACTPSLTALASRSRERLQGVISFQELATPIWGLTQSSSPMPTARSIPRAAAFSSPSVTSRLRGLMSGSPDEGAGLEDAVALCVMSGFYDPVHRLKPRSRPADMDTSDSASRDDELPQVPRIGYQRRPTALEPQDSEAGRGKSPRKTFRGGGRSGGILSERRCQIRDPGGMPDHQD